jgi:hypothetical protein
MILAIDVFRLMPIQSCMMIVNNQGEFSVINHFKGGEGSEAEVATFNRNDKLNSYTLIVPDMDQLLMSISSFLTSQNKSKG